MSAHAPCGIWIGENATVAVVEEFQISFLRLRENLLACVLKYDKYGVVGVVYGRDVNFEASGSACIKNPETGTVFVSDDEAQTFIENHSKDVTDYDDAAGRLVYTVYDGAAFSLLPAERIEMSDFGKTYEADADIPLPRRMALWRVGRFLEYRCGYIRAGIDTEKYSIFFYVDLSKQYIYCRVGQNGYCETGWEMLSTICIRRSEARMLKDNLLSIRDYHPDARCFVPGSCAFPADGGWYWSLKNVSDDRITFNGCGGDIYEIHRPRVC